VPHSVSKLYGGQQFERLLTEFKTVVENIKVEKLSMDDVATAAGPQKLNNAPNTTWAASDIAQKQILRSLQPLLEQLFKRSTYIMKRLVTVVDTMIEQNKKQKKKTGRSTNLYDDLERYPYFLHAVKDLYFKFVDDTAESCKSKCRDEFYSTRLIYWELTSLSMEGKSLNFGKNESREDPKKAVMKLATDLFNQIRDRILKNILLKSYNFFLVPMQTELWSEIQGNITSFSDEQLLELFEVTATKSKLENTQVEMEHILQKFGEKEGLFMEFTNNFSKGNVNGEF